jgi:hypothetical protein
MKRERECVCVREREKDRERLLARTSYISSNTS